MSTPTMGSETVGHLSDETVPGDEPPAKKRQVSGKSPIQIALGRLRKDKVAMTCFTIVMLFVLVAIFADVLQNLFDVTTEPGNPAQQLNPMNELLPYKGPPSGGFDPAHPFGVAPKTATDNLAVWLAGCRTSLLIASLATLVASIIGITLGLIAGFVGGVVDKAISFVIDFFLTIPFLLLALTLAPIINQRFALKPDLYEKAQLWSLVAILAFFGWMGVARLVRGEVLSLREREFILSARVIGMPTTRIMVKELLPNLVAPIVVAVSLMLPAFIAAEAGLAYLGIGITQGNSWGQTILRASNYYDDYALYFWEPLLGIVILVVALNLLGDAIRDAVDPKTRR
ncbi:ABC transporter permease [Nocardioides sp. 503]|uniref:ABC transporter permease n=1 Tax=Nocardioides sp. 503 TaxID=2508326 RepID=UPI00107037FE|nr:ABC transporter permease [Nocardioides sp. 503]